MSTTRALTTITFPCLLQAARAATRTRTHPTLNPAVAELDIVVPASHSGSSSIINDPFLLILVVTKNEFGEDVFRVTFDDNSTSNQWAYHDSGSDFHVTGIYVIQSSDCLCAKAMANSFSPTISTDRPDTLTNTVRLCFRKPFLEDKE